MSKDQMIVRAEKHGEFKGNILGVFDEGVGRNGMLQMIDIKTGITECEPGWYQTKTRPATAEEEATFCEFYEPRYGSVELKKRRTVR